MTDGAVCAAVTAIMMGGRTARLGKQLFSAGLPIGSARPYAVLRYV